MNRSVLPLIGLLAAGWATFSVARTHPRRHDTNPPFSPPMSMFKETVAAAGLVEASTENISVGTPLAGIIHRVYVTAGQSVEAGAPLFALDPRQLRADLGVRRKVAATARARTEVARSHLDDLTRELGFVRQIKDVRAVSAEEVSHRESAVGTARAALEEARAEGAAADSQVGSAETELERSVIRAPITGEVLQVKVRVGEFAPAAPTLVPLILLGRSKPLHVRVDVDEHEAWRVGAGARAVGHMRGNAALSTPLRFVRFEPFVVPKRSLTGDATERVDTRVLQVIYEVEWGDLRLFVGQQLDVFIDAASSRGGAS